MQTYKSTQQYKKHVHSYQKFIKKPLVIFVLMGLMSQVHQAYAETEETTAETEKKTKNSTTKEKYTTEDGKPFVELAEVTIIGNSKEEQMKNVGSAHSVDEKAITDFDYTDPHSVLDNVPGVYSRSEDGYGLRPNIALRGVRAERSQNVTIMEDGILITPAPYSAPAAYYFPNVARMKKVEVFKGPAAIKYGPRTVGGAINFVSQPTALQGASAKVSASYGSDNFYKVYTKYGNSSEDEVFAYTVEGLFYGADGYLDIENSDKKTGFHRKDLNAKVGWYPDTLTLGEDFEIDHMLIAKLGYADESSNQTYLGITDADHEKNPYLRYSSSQNDHFDSKHYQAHLMHYAYLPKDWTVESKAYYNGFQRDWEKVDGFANNKTWLSSGARISDTLKDPDNAQNKTFYQLLSGDVNTSDLDSPYLNLGLDLTNNARKYNSYGVDVQVKKSFDQELSGDTYIQHEIEAGVRLHTDNIERNHHSRAFAVENKELVYNGLSADKLINKGESNALSAFLLDTITYDKLRLTAGVRAENISSTLTEEVYNFTETTAKNTNDESDIMPGVGAYYQALPEWGVLAGVHGGFSPAGTGREGNTADSESSTNYEGGVRFSSDKANINAELIGFYSDYDNVIGRARASNGSELVGSSFNSGEVDIYGAELAVDMEFGKGLTTETSNLEYTFPVKLAYTYTDSSFQNGFNTKFKEWGNVTKGDELPYVPRHKARLQFGAKLKDNWQAQTSINYTGKMREIAGSGDYTKGATTDSSVMVDISAKKYINDRLSIGFNVQNVLDNQSIASRRPFGARPVKPRSYILSATYEY